MTFLPKARRKMGLISANEGGGREYLVPQGSQRAQRREALSPELERPPLRQGADGLEVKELSSRLCGVQIRFSSASIKSTND